MALVHQARCPYCGETWELDVSSQAASDEEFLDATKEPYAYIPCEDCAYLQFD
ncbi:MAG: hypothetical protein K6T26_00360 [Alicyclobacillus sp.]|nr:hypothetical protein [Alicyclobacillus sp.]